MITPKDKRWWRKAAILSYLKTHEGVDIPEIVSYMNVRCDFTLSALKELEKEGIVERCENGRYYGVHLKKCFGRYTLMRVVIY
jgi:predicted transcriptional regulator